MVFNVCVKFHENMSSSFKVMERTPKIVKKHIKGNNSKSKKIRVMVLVFCTSSYGG